MNLAQNLPRSVPIGTLNWTANLNGTANIVLDRSFVYALRLFNNPWSYVRMPLFYIIMICPWQAPAQADGVKTDKDSIYFESLADSLKLYSESNLEKAKKIALKSLAIADSSSNRKWKILARMRLADVIYDQYEESENSEEGLVYCKEAMTMARAIGDSSLVTRVYVGISLGYSYLGKYPEALTWANKALETAQSLKSGLEEHLRCIYLARAEVYTRLGLYANAIEDYETGYQYFKDHTPIMKGRFLYSEATLYGIMDDYEKAYMKFKGAYDVFEKHNHKYGLTLCMNALGVLLINQKYYPMAKKYLMQALALARTIKALYQEIIAYKFLSVVNYHEGFLDSASHYIEKAIALADSTHSINGKIQGLAFKARMALWQGDINAAHRYDRQAFVLRNTLNLRKNLHGAIEITMKEQAKKHQQQLSFYEKLLPQKKRWSWGIFTALLVLAGLAAFVVRKYRIGFSPTEKWQQKFNQALKAQTESKDELHKQMTTTTANLAIKDRLLHQVMLRLGRIKDKNVSKSVQKDVHETQQLIEANLELNKTWDDFFIHFEKVHPDFLETLRRKYKLSPNELRLAAFVKLNLTYKEICQTLNIQLTSLHTTTHRMRKKLGLSKDVNIYDFFSELK